MSVNRKITWDELHKRVRGLLRAWAHADPVRKYDIEYGEHDMIGVTNQDLAEFKERLQHMKKVCDVSSILRIVYNDTLYYTSVAVPFSCAETDLADEFIEPRTLLFMHGLWEVVNEYRPMDE